MAHPMTRAEAEVLAYLDGGADIEIGPLCRVVKGGDHKAWVQWVVVESCLRAGWIAFVNNFVLTKEGAKAHGRMPARRSS